MVNFLPNKSFPANCGDLLLDIPHLLDSYSYAKYVKPLSFTSYTQSHYFTRT